MTRRKNKPDYREEHYFNVLSNMSEEEADNFQDLNDYNVEARRWKLNKIADHLESIGYEGCQIRSGINEEINWYHPKIDGYINIVACSYDDYIGYISIKKDNRFWRYTNDTI